MVDNIIKLDINNPRHIGKPLIFKNFKYISNKTWANGITRETKKYFELNKNENANYQNLNLQIKRRFTILNVSIRKEELHKSVTQTCTLENGIRKVT